MSIENTELKINGVSFKGVYLAILLSLATTLGSGIWAASSLYSRLTGVEDREIPDIKPLQKEIVLINQKLNANDVDQLQGKLAQLGERLDNILEQQGKLLELQAKFAELNLRVEGMEVTVEKAELVTKDVKEFDSRIKKIGLEIEDLWSGLDFLANPYE